MKIAGMALITVALMLSACSSGREPTAGVFATPTEEPTSGSTPMPREEAPADRPASTTTPPSGALSDFQLTIESPAPFAGVIRLEDLKGTLLGGFATCSTPDKLFFMVIFYAATPPNKLTPVKMFEMTSEQNAAVGTPLPVTITITTDDPTGREQTYRLQGSATYTGDGLSGVFQSDDGRLKGSWKCAFAP